MTDLSLQNPRHIIPDPLPTSPSKKGKPSIPPETGGPTGLEPTRYGDWEKKGRCYDF
ncbi:MAG TPA: DUF1674 domain-containing protein [Alphaproteobacteria bacterium]|nr:DUF1674 domain-containing protein [Alphaproteobacteria bacterium]